MGLLRLASADLALFTEPPGQHASQKGLAPPQP